MDFLIEKGFSKSFIDELINTYDKTTLEMLKLEEANVIEIIDYFKEIGINNIDELLINYIEIFISTKKKVQSSFEKYDIRKLVESINRNVQNIEKI